MSRINAGVPAQIDAMLDRATEAAAEFLQYDYTRVRKILESIARVSGQHAERLGRLDAQETGFGVPEHRVQRNLNTVRLTMEQYGGENYCEHRVDAEKKILLTPKPAGVVLGVTPSTGASAAVIFKIMAALMTRNAIIISPHPAGKRVGAETAQLLARAAIEAGAPADAVQVIAEPTIPLVEAVMSDPRTKLILATGGSGVVRAAYRSGTPAIGVGPGNAPTVVDETADLAKAAECIVISKTFDNSILCTADSVLFAVESIAPRLLGELEKRHVYACSREETDRLRNYLYPKGVFNSRAVGRPAEDLAKAAGFLVPASTRILLAQFDEVIDAEPLTHEKLCPVLGLNIVPDFKTASRRAVDLVSIVGMGHSGSIFTRDAQRVLDFSCNLPTHRVAVNVPGSLGNSGIGTFMPVTMAVGTGYLGGSSSAQNLMPEHLLHWSSTAFASDPSVVFPDFSRLCRERGKPIPLPEEIHDDLRRIVIEELRNLI